MYFTLESSCDPLHLWVINEHPGSAIGYWPEMSLGHVYIVLEPVGSARLTLGDDLYYELCVFMYQR